MGGAQYRQGCSVPWGDIMSTVGGYLEYRGGVQYCGGYLEYRGGYHDARGGYHEYRGGCSVPWGEVFCYLSTPRY